MPEEIQKGGVRRQPVAKLRRQLEGGPAVEERSDRQIAAGEVVEQGRVDVVLKEQPADTVKDARGSEGIRVAAALGPGHAPKNRRIAAARERLAAIEVGQAGHVGR